MALYLRIGYSYLSRGEDGVDGIDGTDGAGVGAAGADGADAADGLQGISPSAPAAAANGADYTGAPLNLTLAAPVAPVAINGIPGRSGYSTSPQIIAAAVVGSTWSVTVSATVPKLLVSSGNSSQLTVGALKYTTLRRIVNTNTTITSTSSFNLLVTTL